MQNIHFPSRSPFVLKDVIESTAEPVTIQGELHLPQATTGPVPAVVLSQGLGGVKDARERRYGRFLAEHGYAALVFDSFVSRGKHRFVDSIRALRVSETMLLADAFAALAYLAGRPDIRGDAISLMGFSYGGMISVLAAHQQLADLFLPGGPRFAGHVSYYGCSIPRLDDPATTGAPVQMYLGEKDKNVNIGRAGQIADDLSRGGSRVGFEVFPGVYHQWDGNDDALRHVRFRLSDLRMQVGADNTIRDERTGIRMNGMASRTAAIIASTHPGGYHIQKHPPTRETTDRMTLDFLARTVAANDTGTRQDASDRAEPSLLAAE